MPEKDFVMQWGDISKQLEQVNARLEELQAQGAGSVDLPDKPMPDEDFKVKASYYITFQQLVQDSYIDYEKYIRSVEVSMTRNLLLTVIDHIDVDDSRVSSIAFKNGSHTTSPTKTEKSPRPQWPGASSVPFTGMHSISTFYAKFVHNLDISFINIPPLGKSPDGFLYPGGFSLLTGRLLFFL